MLELIGNLVQSQIYSYLEPIDLINLSHCSKFFYESVNYNKIWNDYCERLKCTVLGNNVQGNKLSIIEQAILEGEKIKGNDTISNYLQVIEGITNLCYWRKVFILSNYLEASWRSGKYSLKYISIKSIRSPYRVKKMLTNQNSLFVLVTGDLILMYDLFELKERSYIELPTNCSCFTVEANIMYVGLQSGDILRVGINGNRLERHNVWAGSGSDLIELMVVNGEYLCGLSTSSCVEVWSTSVQYHLYSLSGHTDELACAIPLHSPTASSSNHCYLATGAWDNLVMVWDVADGCLLTRFDEHTESVMCMKTLGSTLVTGSFDGTIKVWDWINSKLKMTLEADDEVYCLEVSDHHILGAGSNAKIFVWDWCGKLLTILTGPHMGIIRFIHRILGNKWFVTAGDVRRIVLWNMDTFSTSIVGHRNPLQIGTLAVSPFHLFIASDSPCTSIVVMSFV